MAYDYSDKINNPKVSKINWASLVMQMVALSVVFGLIPEDAGQPLMEITMLVVPTLIQIFRTWFTAK